MSFPDYMNRFSLAILAGGKNSRFGGKNKSIHHFQGKPIISHQLDTLLPVFFNISIITNTPGDFDFIRNVSKFKDLIHNKGPLGGIYTALHVIKTDYVFVLAGDMPFIHPGIVKELIKLANHQDFDALIPVNEKGREPLHAIYHRRLESSLKNYLNHSRKLSVQSFLKDKHVHYYPINQTEPFINVNTFRQLEFYERDRSNQNTG